MAIISLRCYMCKKSKKKCDLGFPSCGRCSRSGHKCEWPPLYSNNSETLNSLELISQSLTKVNHFNQSELALINFYNERFIQFTHPLRYQTSLRYEQFLIYSNPAVIKSVCALSAGVLERNSLDMSRACTYYYNAAKHCLHEAITTGSISPADDWPLLTTYFLDLCERRCITNSHYRPFSLALEQSAMSLLSMTDLIKLFLSNSTNWSILTAKPSFESTPRELYVRILFINWLQTVINTVYPFKLDWADISDLLRPLARNKFNSKIRTNSCSSSDYLVTIGFPLPQDFLSAATQVACLSRQSYTTIEQQGIISNLISYFKAWLSLLDVLFDPENATLPDLPSNNFDNHSSNTHLIIDKSNKVFLNTYSKKNNIATPNLNKKSKLNSNSNNVFSDSYPSPNSDSDSSPNTSDVDILNSSPSIGIVSSSDYGLSNSNNSDNPKVQQGYPSINNLINKSKQNIANSNNSQNFNFNDNNTQDNEYVKNIVLSKSDVQRLLAKRESSIRIHRSASTHAYLYSAVCLIVLNFLQNSNSNLSIADPYIQDLVRKGRIGLEEIIGIHFTSDYLLAWPALIIGCTSLSSNVVDELNLEQFLCNSPGSFSMYSQMVVHVLRHVQEVRNLESNNTQSSLYSSLEYGVQFIHGQSEKWSQLFS